TVLVRPARVLVFEHVLGFRDAAVEITLVPDLKIGELIVGREEGMRFASPLGLCRLVEPLPLHPCLGICAVDFLAEGLDRGNMRPLLRLPLCAMASTSLPVFSSV